MTQENGRSTRLIIGLVIGAIFGLGIGLLFGYVIAPVQWVDGTPQDLRSDYAAYYWQMVAESYGDNGDVDLADRRLGAWTDQERLQAALDRAHIESSVEQQQVLQSLSSRLVVGAAPAGPSTDVTEAPEADDDRTGLKINWGTFLLTLLLVLLVLVAFALLVTRARKSRARASVGEEPFAEGAVDTSAPDVLQRVSAPPGEDAALADAPPLAHLTTTYTQNREYYDEAVGIETAKGDFLGESGISIVERLDENAPDKVTAFEVFLFDKGELRTVTKVLMSEYAYNDEELRKRLMEKGDLVLAQVNQPVVIETTALRLEATITDMLYGIDDVRPNSYFEKLSTELVVRQIGPIIDKMASAPEPDEF
jgi:hypothetical protein